MDKFMELAINEARIGMKKGHGAPFGAVIVKNGEVVGVGHNQIKKKKDPTCHAEVMAIRSACKNLKSFDLTDCDMYTTLYPCPMCFGAILWSNLRKIYYGCATLDTQKIGLRDKIFRKLSESKKGAMCERLDSEECLKLYEEYKKKEACCER